MKLILKIFVIINEITVKDGSKEIIKYIKTPYLDIPAVTVHVNELGEGDPFNQDLYFMIGSWNIPFNAAYDIKGDIRYYNKEYSTYRISYYKEIDEIILENATNIATPYGKEIITFKNNDGLHHDRIKIRNGNYIALENSQFGFEDAVSIFDKDGNKIEKRYIGDLFRKAISGSIDITDESIKNIVYDDKNPYTTSDGKKHTVDWAHLNSIVYDEDKNILYISMQRTGGVLAVNWSNWELIWFMVNDSLNDMDIITQDDVNISLTVGTLKNVSALEKYRVMNDGKTDGPINQHALFLHENGNLAMFDNQDSVNFNPAGSRYVQYSITDYSGNYTATKVKQYRIPSLHSLITSDVDFVGDENKNLLILWGTKRRIQEIDLENNNKVLFDIELSVISDAEYEGGVIYRADKMPLYPYQDKNKKYSIDYNAIDEK